MNDHPDIENQRRALFDRLEALGIRTTVEPYPEHETVEEGKALRGDMAGTFTKNLLLKDKKGQLFLVAAHEDREIDLKTLHTRIGARGRLGFAGPDRMIAALGVEPGALTPLAVLNDTARSVSVVIDADLMESEQVNFHPLLSTESVGLKPSDLVKFVESCERSPIIAKMGSEYTDTGTAYDS